MKISTYFAPNFLSPSIFVQTSWNWHQITISYRETMLGRIFKKSLKIDDFVPLFHEKWPEFRYFGEIFPCNSRIKSTIFKIVIAHSLDIILIQT